MSLIIQVLLAASALSDPGVQSLRTEPKLAGALIRYCKTAKTCVTIDRSKEPIVVESSEIFSGMIPKGIDDGQRFHELHIDFGNRVPGIKAFEVKIGHNGKS